MRTKIFCWRLPVRINPCRHSVGDLYFMKSIFVFFFAICFSGLMNANSKDSVYISGMAPEYANLNITIQVEKNYITRENEELRTFYINKEGRFKTSVYVNETQKILIQLGEVMGYLFVTPGKSYVVELPPYRPLKEEDKFNPFFMPEPILLGFSTKTDTKINENIRHFEDYYNQEFATNIKRILLTRNKSLGYKIIKDANQECPSEKGTYFDLYKMYSFLNLESYLVSNKNDIIYRYYSNQPVLYKLEPYWTSFNSIFYSFFHYYFESGNGDNLKEVWSKENCSFTQLCQTLQEDSLYNNRSFSELVILKALYDEFYSENNVKTKVIQLVKQAVNECGSVQNKQLARDIYIKISHLLAGSKAPDFHLTTLSGKEVDLSDFKGKFVYLNFANTRNYACKKDFQALDKLSQLLKKDVTVVTVLTDENPEEAAAYIKQNKFNWKFLHFNQNAKVLYDYRIKAFPTYFLIDPEGNLVFSPAPGPEENFAPAFSEEFNNYRYKKIRKEKPKSRTIYDL